MLLSKRSDCQRSRATLHSTQLWTNTKRKNLLTFSFFSFQTVGKALLIYLIKNTSPHLAAFPEGAGLKFPSFEVHLKHHDTGHNTKSVQKLKIRKRSVHWNQKYSPAEVKWPDASRVLHFCGAESRRGRTSFHCCPSYIQLLIMQIEKVSHLKNIFQHIWKFVVFGLWRKLWE